MTHRGCPRARVEESISVEEEEPILPTEKLPEKPPHVEDENLRLKVEQAQDESTPLEDLRALSEDENEEIRIALALREVLPGPLEARLVRDPSSRVVRALVQNPHSSNFCIAHAPRWITWENNGRVYDKRRLPHYYWDMMTLYLAGTGAVAMPLFSIMFHVIFDFTLTPYPWLLSLFMMGGFGVLFARRRRNYPEPEDWGAWDL